MNNDRSSEQHSGRGKDNMLGRAKQRISQSEVSDLTSDSARRQSQSESVSAESYKAEPGGADFRRFMIAGLVIILALALYGWLYLENNSSSITKANEPADQGGVVAVDGYKAGGRDHSTLPSYQQEQKANE